MTLLRKRIPVSQPANSQSSAPVITNSQVDKATNPDLQDDGFIDNTDISTLANYSEEQRKTPLKAIRQMCLNCCEGSSARVEKCNLKECPLHHMRFGKGVFSRKGHKGRVISEGHKRKMQEGRKRQLKEKGNEKTKD